MITKVLGLMSAVFISQVALADNIILQPGSSIQITANQTSYVSCAGGSSGGSDSRVLSCFCEYKSGGQYQLTMTILTNGETKNVQAGVYNYSSDCDRARQSNQNCK